MTDTETLLDDLIKFYGEGGIVRYPNRDAFIRVFTDPEYREGHRHGVAATLRHRMVMLLEAPM